MSLEGVLCLGEPLTHLPPRKASLPGQMGWDLRDGRMGARRQVEGKRSSSTEQVWGQGRGFLKSVPSHGPTVRGV